MAKVTGPLFSMRASGTLAKTIVFVCGHYARMVIVQDDSQKVMPPGQNDKFAAAVVVWNGLSGDFKGQWTEFEKRIKDSKKCVAIEPLINGYQLFISYYLKWGVNGWENYPLPGPPPSFE
jgi:hypothetical protein